LYAELVRLDFALNAAPGVSRFGIQKEETVAE
jgi:hypothetical protein